MDRPIKWISSLFKDAVSRTIVVFLSGVLLTFLTVVVSGKSFDFLSRNIVIPAFLLIILSLFAILGVAAITDKVIQLAHFSKISKSKQSRRDERLEDAMVALLSKLNEVEVGRLHFVEWEQQKFKLELLSLFDKWETAVYNYLDFEAKEIAILRQDILNSHFHGSQDKASDWISKIKEYTHKARFKVTRI